MNNDPNQHAAQLPEEVTAVFEKQRLKQLEINCEREVGRSRERMRQLRKLLGKPKSPFYRHRSKTP